jgi:Zn-dependent M28 family amino/carboxypeptidase
VVGLEGRLRRHLEVLVRPRDPFENRAALDAAADYLGRSFRECGLTVREDVFRVDGQAFRNIVAALPGAKVPEEQVLVTAHYDTKPGTPGADDNASALAAILEAARILAGQRYGRTLLFAGFSLEEYGYGGSRHFVREAKRAHQAITGVLDLEMVGFTAPAQRLPPGIRARNTGDFIGVVGNRKSRHLVQTFVTAARQAAPDLPVETLIVAWNGRLLPIVRLSDHAPFWDAGYPAVMITDTAFLRNPHYHQPSDTLETLDLPFLARVTAATAATAARLAAA